MIPPHADHNLKLAASRTSTDHWNLKRLGIPCNMPDKQVVIVGGGLAGLVCALHLVREGVRPLVVEKNRYPFHRVCGEYISNEVIPYLESLSAFPASLSPARISRFQLTSTGGNSTELPLDLGGFGISRYAFDHYLFTLASQRGVAFRLGEEVNRIQFKGNDFRVELSAEVLSADVVVGSFGKRSRLDKELNRSFISRSSPYVGVKYHLLLPEFARELISLHNFEGGYAGISAVEDNRINFCYLTHRDQLRAHGNLKALEGRVLCRNPYLREIFEEAEFLFDKPEVINEISFETKSPVDSHILMTGDAAGMIAPLCGNGMATAIHSAKLAAEHILRFCRDSHYTREAMERDYAATWRRKFSARLWAGRHIQRLFGNGRGSNLAVALARSFKPVAYQLMKRTHGSPF
jgi:flavin-dependent dehydrogenase